MDIHLAEIFVSDQDRALAFYTETLGFEVHTDAPYGEDYRWLTVSAPGKPEVELQLAVPDDEPARSLQKARYDAGRPAIAFHSSDIQAEYKTLQGKGVRFTMAPTKMPYGGTDAVFDDTCGNLICLHQDG
jgi:catechol 2,3-dioxygenase-like lactoylglutathione lyase family enzyme